MTQYLAPVQNELLEQAIVFPLTEVQERFLLVVFIPGVGTGNGFFSAWRLVPKIPCNIQTLINAPQGFTAAASPGIKSVKAFWVAPVVRHAVFCATDHIIS